ncbi:hypothetical protein TNCV_4345891 [Trichonephila clavipes]|nr:hypothetical protein TNCV_4345891 [Trichonephila clavipes]
MFQILLWSLWTYRCGQRTGRLADCGSQSQAVFARRRSKSKLKLLDIRAELGREKRTREILLWYPWKGKNEYVPLRTAYSQVGRLWHPRNPIVSRQRSLRAQAQQIQTKTLRNFWTLEKIREQKERRRCASRRYRHRIM